METGYDNKEQQLWGEISQLLQRETQEEQEAAKAAAEVASDTHAWCEGGVSKRGQASACALMKGFTCMHGRVCDCVCDCTWASTHFQMHTE